MRRAFPSISAAAFGLGMFACSSVDAQIPTSSRTEAALAASKSPSETVKLRDANRLIGASVSTTSGRYGAVADLVVDGSGAVQYALVEREGKFHPVPFALMQFGATGDVTLSVSSATLDGLTVDRNNLQSLTNREFAAQLRSAFGPNVARELAASTGATSTTGTASSRANRDRVFPMSGMFGGSIATRQGGSPGTIATAAINPNGTVAYFVGSNASGDSRFAVPFSQSTLNSNFNGISVEVSTETLVTVSVPQNSLPTMADQSFAASLRNTFGSGITNDSRGIAGGIDGLTQQEADIARRNDRSNSDPVAGAGDPARGGANAVAGAGDTRRGGVDAVARPGDRATPGGTGTQMTTTGQTTTGGVQTSTGVASTGVGATGTTSTGSTTGGLVNAAPQTSATTSNQAGVNSQNGLLQFRDLLNLRIQAQDGAFGRVSDIVLDQNGNVQYMLGTHQGQTFPLPLNQAALANAADGTLTYDIPRATLQEMSINPQNLPTMQNQQFTQRMQQVFGDGFRSNSGQSSYPPATGFGPGEGVGNGQPPGGLGRNTGPGVANNPPRAAGTGATGGTGATTGTGANSTMNPNSRTGTGTKSGTAQGSTSAQDGWQWPGGWGPGEGVGNGRQPGGAGVNSGRPIRGTGTGSAGTGTGNRGTGPGMRNPNGLPNQNRNGGNWGPGEGVGNGRPPGGAGVDSGPPVRRQPGNATGNQGGTNNRGTGGGNSGTGGTGSGSTGGASGGATGGGAGGAGGAGGGGGGAGGSGS